MLEDGSIYDGIGFGYTTDIVGEVVFNTGMVGYTESLTDPSYRGQILCLTYPLIGNYGVPSAEDTDEFGLPRFFESDRIQVKGLIIHDLSVVASHWSCVKTLDEWLYEQKIPGICNIDTREITKKLRINGVMVGAISLRAFKEDTAANSQTEARSRLSVLIKNQPYDQQNFMPEVSTNIPREHGDKTRDTLVLLDTGTKNSIIRNMLRIGFRVVRLPWDSSYEEVMLYKPKGIVISNGPGDPKVCKTAIKTAGDLIRASIPTLGICLGNQILALAAGADTYKLKFGHRGQNKPCIDLRSNRTYITSQNHGYGIEPESLEGTGFKVWFSNVDDHTIEGIEHESKPIIAVQFHPEASPGPYDCIFVFDRFKELVDDFNKGSSAARTIKDEIENIDSSPKVKMSAARKKKKSLKRRKFAKK